MKQKILFLFFIITSQISIAQCENFEMTITSSNPLCPGYSDGSITVSQTGGNGAVDGSITDSDGVIQMNTGIGTCPNPLIAGWYFIYLIDELGCELYDSVYLEDPDEMDVILNITLPSSVSACDGIAEIDTVLHHIGTFDELTFWWSGGPGGLYQTIKSDICFGNYSVTVNNQVGCGVTKEFTVGNLSAEENTIPLSFEIYPNPTTYIIQIKSEFQIEEIIILDLSGKIVFQSTDETITNQSINVEHLSDGLYQLVLQGGDFFHSETFIKTSE